MNYELWINHLNVKVFRFPSRRSDRLRKRFADKEHNCNDPQGHNDDCNSDSGDDDDDDDDDRLMLI